MTEPVEVQVECYSGHTYAQEPRAVVWRGRRCPVSHVVQRWRGPQGPVFCVQTEAGDRFELQYDEQVDRWTLRSLGVDEDIRGQGGPEKT